MCTNIPLWSSLKYIAFVYYDDSWELSDDLLNKLHIYMHEATWQNKNKKIGLFTNEMWFFATSLNTYYAKLSLCECLCTPYSKKMIKTSFQLSDTNVATATPWCTVFLHVSYLYTERSYICIPFKKGKRHGNLIEFISIKFDYWIETFARKRFENWKELGEKSVCNEFKIEKVMVPVI